MTEQDFRTRHPDLTLKCGRSSENKKWWADARQMDGHCIALSGRATLAQVLLDLDALGRRLSALRKERQMAYERSLCSRRNSRVKLSVTD